MPETVVLITNGGPHPADKWAALAAEQISNLIQVDELSDSDAAATARKAKPRFEIAISDVLEPVFDQVMTAERSSVDAGTTTLRNAPFELEEFLDSAVAAVVEQAGSTPFAAHFALSDVQFIVRNILQQNFIDAANIARSWALDAKGL